MYEQYTDKQIVEMLVPKLEKLGWEPEFFSPRMEKLISILYKSGYTRGQLGRSFIIGEKKTKEPVNPFKVGDKVKFLGIGIDDIEILDSGRFYPPVNTVGKVVRLDFGYCVVQWPDGTTSGKGIWCCQNKYLEKVTERWVSATRDNIKVGSKVRYLNAEKHLKNPEFYPVQGTIGKVVSVIDDNTYLVQWPDYTTVWFANQSDLEVLVDGLDEVEPTKAKKWVPASKNNVKSGCKVRMIDNALYESNPLYFPAIGTVGTVINTYDGIPLVQWPPESTSEKDRWFSSFCHLEVLLCE